jgi:RimJ/RimL family protein N-acetyltransferase
MIAELEPLHYRLDLFASRHELADANVSTVRLKDSPGAKTGTNQTEQDDAQPGPSDPIEQRPRTDSRMMPTNHRAAFVVEALKLDDRRGALPSRCSYGCQALLATASPARLDASRRIDHGVSMSADAVIPGQLRIGENAPMTEVWPAQLLVRPLTTEDAGQIAQWRYDGPWRIYDSRPKDGLMSDNGAYLAVAGVDGGPLVGFCCSGAEATVPGLKPEDGVLDVGVGMNPAMVGQGNGVRFASAVLDHYRSTTGIHRLRAVVQSWNQRSLRLTRSLGFVEVGKHMCEQSGAMVEYTVVIAE